MDFLESLWKSTWNAPQLVRLDMYLLFSSDINFVSYSKKYFVVNSFLQLALTSNPLFVLCKNISVESVSFWGVNHINGTCCCIWWSIKFHNSFWYQNWNFALCWKILQVLFNTKNKTFWLMAYANDSL